MGMVSLLWVPSFLEWEGSKDIKVDMAEQSPSGGELPPQTHDLNPSAHQRGHIYTAKELMESHEAQEVMELRHILGFSAKDLSEAGISSTEIFKDYTTET